MVPFKTFGSRGGATGAAARRRGGLKTHIAQQRGAVEPLPFSSAYSRDAAMGRIRAASHLERILTRAKTPDTAAAVRKRHNAN